MRKPRLREINWLGYVHLGAELRLKLAALTLQSCWHLYLTPLPLITDAVREKADSFFHHRCIKDCELGTVTTLWQVELRVWL